MGYNAGSVGGATVDGSGSEWSNSGDLYVGSGGRGTLIITNGSCVNDGGNAYVAYNSSSYGAATVAGANSTWTNTGAMYVGIWGNGSLRVTNGGIVSDSTGYVGQYNTAAGANGLVTVVGANSRWVNSGNLYLGPRSYTSYPGGGTLIIAGGGAVTAASVSIANSQSLLAVDVGSGSSLTVNAGTGAITNNGTVRVLAGANVPTGGTYTPISAGMWSGTGKFQAVGGTWDASNHQFIVSAIQTGAAGTQVSIDPSVMQRMLITDSTTQRVMGLSFLAASSSKEIDVLATTISGDPLGAAKFGRTQPIGAWGMELVGQRQWLCHG